LEGEGGAEALDLWVVPLTERSRGVFLDFARASKALDAYRDAAIAHRDRSSYQGVLAALVPAREAFGSHAFLRTFYGERLARVCSAEAGYLHHHVRGDRAAQRDLLRLHLEAVESALRGYPLPRLQRERDELTGLLRTRTSGVGDPDPPR
jgi:hypothetical protein